MSDMWQFILSSHCLIYHNFVSTATHGRNMVPLGTGQPRASSAPGPRSLKCVTYLSCSGVWPNSVTSLSDTRRDRTGTSQTTGLERSCELTRWGLAPGPAPGRQIAAPAATY